VRRIYECGARTEDIALLARCSPAQLNKIAAHEGWSRGGYGESGKSADPALGAALADIEAALRWDDLGRAEFARLIDRAMALTAAEALKGAPVERTAATLTRLASIAKGLPDDAPAAPALRGDIVRPDEPADFPDANELIEEIARRFEQFAEDHLDPRILALVAETIA
jgi:hypothetical protein